MSLPIRFMQQPQAYADPAFPEGPLGAFVRNESTAPEPVVPPQPLFTAEQANALKMQFAAQQALKLQQSQPVSGL